jgi:hypothetical protein
LNVKACGTYGYHCALKRQEAAHFIVFALGGTFVLQVMAIRDFQFDKY